LDVEADIYYTGSDTSGFAERLYNAVVTRCYAIQSLDGVQDTFNPCKDLTVTSPDGSTFDGGGYHAPPNGEQDPTVGAAGAQTRESGNGGLGAIGAMVIAAGALALVLVFLLVAKKSRSKPNHLKHVQLDDGDFDDDASTYMHDAEVSSSPDRARVVDESDSVTTGWTMYNSNVNRSQDMLDDTDLNISGLSKNTGTNDVHKCSSATCEVCERERQSGLQFVPVSMPAHSSHERIPHEADRSYISEDMVEL
jgi:hypothetical protein